MASENAVRMAAEDKAAKEEAACIAAENKIVEFNVAFQDVAYEIAACNAAEEEAAKCASVQKTKRRLVRK